MSSVLTLVAHQPFSGEPAALRALLAEYNIAVSRERQVADHVLDVFTPDDVSGLRGALDAFCAAHAADVAVQPVYNRKKRLVVFDMDSTLIVNECIDLMAAKAGVEQQVAAITEEAMRGNLDFAASLAQRVALLRGIPVSIYDEVIAKITLTPGARELCAALKRNNVKLAVLSGGFQPIVDWIKDLLGLDYAYANTLVSDGETLAGTTAGRVVDGAMKAQLLREIAENEGLTAADALAVGDGSNDLPMMALAGYGVAWHAKPRVRKEAPAQLNSPSLHDVLYILGYH